MSFVNAVHSAYQYRISNGKQITVCNEGVDKWRCLCQLFKDMV